MNDRDLENLFASMDTRPGAGARDRALAAALQTFDTVQDEANNAAVPQGIAAAGRLTLDKQSLGRKIMHLISANQRNPRWRYTAIASTAVFVLSMVVTLQWAQHGAIQVAPSEVASIASSDETASVQAQKQSPQAARFEFHSILPPQQLSTGLQHMREAKAIASRNSIEVQDAAYPPAMKSAIAAGEAPGAPVTGDQDVGRDRFETVDYNPIKRVSAEPVSTFSIDVDTASYSFVRRQLNAGVLPQKAAVRLEEMINYFPYDYPVPQDRSEPFSTHVTVLDSPWKAGNKLVHIGIQGYEVAGAQPRSNLVFLLDVSGSMDSPDKLPLVKQSISLLLDRLQPQDSVAIVVYAGAAGTVLEPTPVKEKQKILAALNRLQAGGATAGAEGIQLAYQLAESQFIDDGVNRIVLATDGDFNVGISDVGELKGFVERKRASGVFLSVLGFGEGNYQDALMQALAQNGNGIAAYIDTLGEAQKVLVDEATSTLFPIAKDVKIQVEFNPATVSEYRLLGYETRMLAEEDFNNDAVDAGDIGAGHSVTAIYEITPTGSQSGAFADSRYGAAPAKEGKPNEYGYLKLRYKLPNEDKSRLISQPIGINAQPIPEVLHEARFATAVAGFAQLLQGGKYLAGWTYDDALKLAQAHRGDDPFGYRAEFVQLIRKVETADTM
jgi:Ca-activated chloride channel family protein